MTASKQSHDGCVEKMAETCKSFITEYIWIISASCWLFKKQSNTFFIFTCNCGACLLIKHSIASMPKFTSNSLFCGKNCERLASVNEQVIFSGNAFDFVIGRCAFLIWVRQGLYCVCV